MHFNRPLHFFSTFPFETELGHLVDMKTGMKNLLSQLVRRIAEREALEDSGYLIFDADQYFTQMFYNQFVKRNFSRCKRNSYVIIDNTVIRVTFIAADKIMDKKMSL